MCYSVPLRYRLHIAVVVFAYAFGAHSGFAVPPSPNSCHRGVLSENLLWATSGVEALHEPGILVVDAVRAQIMHLDRHGWLRQESISGSTVLGRLRQIRTDNDGYLIMYLSENNLPRILRANRHLELVDTLPYEPAQVLGIYDFASFSGGVLAFGDVLMPEPTTGLFYIDAQGETTAVYSLESPSNSTVFNYVTDDTNRFLASLNGRVYMLFLDEEPWIGHISSEGQQVDRLPFFPEDFRYFPAIAESSEWKLADRGLEKTKAYFEVVESTPRMAAGLYASRERNTLHLLARSNSSHPGHVDWWVIQLDPHNGSELTRLKLPTKAAHLTVVPGSEFWSLIEKDFVESLYVDKRTTAPYIRTAGLTLVPSRWVATQSGPMGAGHDSLDCDSLSLR